MLIVAAGFLLDALGGFFGILFLLRFFMQAFRASFAGPLGHFVIALTDWAVKPLRRFVPGLFGLDLASLVAAFLLACLLSLAFLALTGRLAAADAPLLVLIGALLRLVRLTLYLFIFALIVEALLSWFHVHSPLGETAHQLTGPVLAPIRRVLPPVSGIDLSPLVAILLAQLVLIFV